MNAKVYLAISLALNVMMALAILVQDKTLRMDSAFGRPVRTVVLTNNPTIRLSKTNVVLRPSSFFTWRDLETADYPAYIYNLRSVGCPETTVRDIIVADVNQLFVRRRRSEMATNDMAWWRPDAEQEAQRAVLRRAQGLEEERRTLLTQLLGPHWDENPADATSPVGLAGPVLGALSPELQQQVQDISARSSERMRAYLKDQEQLGQTASPSELAKLRDKTRAELALVLSPEQLEEFLLRYSQSASRLRQQLRGFNTTPEEFRTLFRAADSIETRLAALGDDPANARARQELEQQRDTAIRNVLGYDRYQAARLQTLQQDPAYREALSAAEKAGASSQAALTLYEINQATAIERDRIKNDPNLTEEQKLKELEAINRQQAKAKDQALGKETPPATDASTAPAPRVASALPMDTLGQISLRYGVRMSELRRANPDVDFGRLQPGQQIVIPPTVPPDDTKWIPVPSGVLR